MVRMKTLIILLFITLLGSYELTAQRKVKSGSYNLMLRKLLKHTVPEISVDSAAAVKTICTFLDAREKNEYDVSHINNSIYVGYNDFKIDAIKNIEKNTPIIVYCSVGYRSEKISEKLIAAGYKNVQNMYGGIFEWKNENNIVVNKSGTTNNVHAFSKTWGIWLKKGKKIYSN
jgi:rhodanese-related sulfurtransferase